MNTSQQFVLIVDDYRPILMAICETLEGEGYDVLPANSGQEALELMGWVHPALIIADIMMPDMNGFELYDRIHTSPEWQAIPFVFLTGVTEEEHAKRARELGVDAYLTKPISREDLLAAVRKQLERGEAELDMEVIRLRPTEIDIDKLLDYINAGAGASPPALGSIRLSGQPTNWDFSLLRDDQLEALDLAAV